jgi:beta-glucosidase
MTAATTDDRTLAQAPEAPITRRAQELVSRMTIAEKVAELTSIWKDPLMDNCDPVNGDFNPERARAVLKDGMGRISAIFHTFTPRHSAATANVIQRFVREITRLGIPVLIDCEALHGVKSPGSTIYPQAIALAATWAPALVGRIGEAIGKEARARGNHQVLAPVCDLARDVRCGRTEETYGEDVCLASRLAVAFVRGVQSQRVIATVKHFVANFVGEGGRDSAHIGMSERELREVHLPVFEAAIREGGALSVMAAYHAIDGVPACASTWLLRQLLKDEWGFEGAVVSDWFAVKQLHTHHRTARDLAEAAKMAIEAGLDQELPVADCTQHIRRLVRSGEVSVEAIDDAVRRLLYSKLWAGAFDEDALSPEEAERVNGCAEHRALALEAARKSMVLLKNDGLLPLDDTKKTIAVIGPSAAVARLGGYSPPTPSDAVSPLDGLKRVAPRGVTILAAEGCTIDGTSKDGFAEAMRVAREADAVILCVGNSEKTEGEGRDRCDLDLPGVQQELVLEIAKANPSTVVVLIGGSAVTMRRWIGEVAAIVEAWYPGEEGGIALAELLFGITNPSGRLPITFPVTAGQCPLYYNPKPTGRVSDYVDLRGKQAQFPFGFGLSYTTFEYADLRISVRGRGKDTLVRVSLTVENTGQREGDEVVQLYVHCGHGVLSRPVEELKGFERVSLRPGEKRPVKLTLAFADLASLDRDLTPALEPGALEILVGASSEDIRLRGRAVLR